MKSKLRNLEITEGSLVDKGANQHAAVMLFKNHSDSERGEHMDDIDKAGKTLSAKNKSKLRQAMDTIMGVIGTEDKTTETQKGDSMSENVEDMQKRIDELQPEADKVEGLVAQVEELNKKLEDLNKVEDEPEDVLKGASEEVQKAMKLMEDRVAKAESDAKDANEAVLTKRFADMATELKGESDKNADMLRKAHDADFGDELHEMLKALSAQIDESTLTDEVGSSSETENDADQKLETLAKAHADKHDTTYEQGVAAVLRTPEGRKIHSERGDI